MNLGFFQNVFLSPEIDWVFFGNGQQSNACAGHKKPFFFVMRGLNLMQKQKKNRKIKHRGLTHRLFLFSTVYIISKKCLTAVEYSGDLSKLISYYILTDV